MNKLLLNSKKILSSILISSIVFSIISPALIFAENYSFDTNTKVPAVKAVAQKYDISIARDIVSGDSLELFISGSTDYNTGTSSLTYTQRYGSGASKDFTTSTGVLSDFCDQISAGNLANCSFDEINKKFIIESKIAGKALELGEFKIIRDPLLTQTIPHIVAKAKKVAYKIENDFLDGDKINLAIGTGTISYDFSGALDKAANLELLANQITNQTSVSGSYNSASGTIELESKIAGNDFSVSEFITDSTPIYTNTGGTANVVAVAQKEEINLRTISSDETISLYFSGLNFSGTISQTFSGTSLDTINSLISNLDLLEDVNASLTGANSIEVVSANPGIPFTINNIRITGGKINTYNSISNQVAISQVDYIKLPRELYSGDRINYFIAYSGGSSNIFQNYEGGNYLSGLVDTINSTNSLNEYIEASIESIPLQTIKLTSKIAGTPFTGGSLFITSNILSSKTQTGIIAVKQESSLSLDRDFATGDKITFIIDGNVITQDFDTDNSKTLSELVSKINSGSTTAQASISGNTINFIAKTAGIGFDIHGLKVVNNIYPNILQVAENPTLQTNIINVPTSLAESQLGLNISSTFVSGNNLTDLINNINSQSGINASLEGNNLIIKSNSPTNDFTLSDLVQTGAVFTGTTSQTSTSEIKAKLELSIDDLSNLSGNSIDIGNCNIIFTTGGLSEDYDCSDNSTSIDLDGLTINKLSALIRGISGISDLNNGILSKNGTGTGIIFETAGTQISSTGIYFSGAISGLNLVSNSNPQVGNKQISSISLPREFLNGDTLTMSLSGDTISQSFYISSGSSLIALVNQINALDYLNASLVGNTINLESKNIGESFSIGDIQFINKQTSTQTISNYSGKEQKTILALAYNLSENDKVNIAIDGLEKTFSGNNLVADITASYSGITASSTGANSILLSGNIGQNFSVNKFEITRDTSSHTLTGNIVAVRDIEELRIPLNLISGLNGALNINLSDITINQNYNSDLSGTLDSLNSKINNAGFVSTYTTDGTYAIFNITGKVDGTDFGANLSSTGISETTQNQIPNTESGAQVDTLSLAGRNFNTNDILTFSLIGSDLAFSQIILSGSLDLNTIYNNLNSAINNDLNNQAINSTLSGGILEFTSKVPGTSFGTGLLEVENILASSTNLVQNVVAVKQVDTLTIPRNLVSGDNLTISFNSGAYIVNRAFSGTENSTLSEFVSKINNSLSGVLESSLSDKNITFTAITAGIGFQIDSLNLKNTYSYDLLQENVVAMPQITTISIPELVTGDLLSFNIGGNIISSNSINGLVSNINSSGSLEANATYNSASGTIVLTGKIPGLPFSFSETLVNYTSPIASSDSTDKMFVSPIDQVSESITIGNPRLALTYFVSINRVNYEYTTGSGDTNLDVITNLSTQINTGSIASTGAIASISGNDTLILTSYSSGIAFIANSGIADKTAPIILEGVNNSIETLKSGDISNGKISINEDGIMYFVLSGSYNGDSNTISNLIDSGSGFSVNLLSNTSTGVKIPAGIKDGLYNLVASDFGMTDTFSGTTFIPNYSSETNGFIIIDNTAPIVDINTLSGITVNTDTINITGTSEANTKILSMTITSSGEFTKTNYVGENTNGAGNFSLTGTLYQNTTNIISVELQDEAGNIGTANVTINQDNINPSFINLDYKSLTKENNATINILSESNISAQLFSGASLISSGITNSTGELSLSSDLALNQANNFTIKLTDIAGNTTNTGIVILQDSNVPVILGLTPVNNTRVHQDTINISGISEVNSKITITNSGKTYTGTTSSTGAFDISLDLEKLNGTKTNNDISINVIDEAGNEYNTGITIIEDSIPNSLIIGTYPSYTKNSQVSFTGTYKAGTILSFTGGESFEEPLLSSNKFQASVNLKQNQENIIEISASDGPLGSTGVTMNIIHDNIAPSLNISTLSGQTTNNSVFNISGVSEIASIITITGGAEDVVINTGTGTEFTASIQLNKNSNTTTINNLLISASDLLGNTTTYNFVVTQDPIINFVELSASGTYNTNSSSFSFTGYTKADSILMFSLPVNNLELSSNGYFSGIVQLEANTLNNFIVSSTDATNTTATGGFIVNQDSLAPNLVINPLSSEYTNSDNLIISGISETGSLINVGNIESISTGTFSINYPLSQNILNNINIKATDIAGNISTGILNITHDNIKSSFSGITMNQVVLSGSIMTIDYGFNSSEYTSSTIYFGTGTNVLDSLVASKTNTGNVFSGSVYGFDSTKNYYYFIESTDLAGNISKTIVTQIDSIPVITPITDNNGAKIDYLPVISSGEILSGTTSVLEGFVKLGETNIGNLYSLSGGLVENILLTGSSNIDVTLDDNTKLYTTTGTLSFEKTILNISYIIENNIQKDFVSALRIGGSETILLSKAATIIFKNASDVNKLAYKKSSLTTWTYEDISLTECSVNYDDQVCAFKSGNDVIVKTLHFTDFALVKETTIIAPTPTPTPVRSSGGGSGGGVSRDYCPAGDYSTSYYDRSCGVKPIISTGSLSLTGNISTGITNNTQTGEIVVSKEAYTKYIKYNGFSIFDVKNYKYEANFRKVAFDIIRNDKISARDKIALINRHNALLEAKFALDMAKEKTDELMNKYLKLLISFNTYYDRVLSRNK